MRAYVPAYRMITPGSLEEALELLGEWRPFAGGTDLMVLLNAGKLEARNFLNLWPLEELRGVEVADHSVRLGALTTYTQVQEHPVLQREFPNLVAAASQSGGPAIQNRGTLGGNIANASPAADSPPALLAYEAVLELVSRRGARRVPYREFHRGYKEMDLDPDELVAAIHLPRIPGRTHYYRKVGTRRMQAIAKVGLAACAVRTGDRVTRVRLGLSAVAPTVCSCPRTAAFLEGRPPGEGVAEARELLREEIAPIDDLRSTREYRARVAANLLEDWWTGLARRKDEPSPARRDGPFEL